VAEQCFSRRGSPPRAEADRERQLHVSRPLVCRLFPFDYDEQGIRDALADGCPLHLIRPGWTLLTELDMKRDDAERWHKQLYHEIQLEESFRESGELQGDARPEAVARNSNQ
jgi:hypothetical protein